MKPKRLPKLPAKKKAASVDEEIAKLAGSLREHLTSTRADVSSAKKTLAFAQKIIAFAKKRADHSEKAVCELVELVVNHYIPLTQEFAGQNETVDQKIENANAAFHYFILTERAAMRSLHDEATILEKE